MWDAVFKEIIFIFLKLFVMKKKFVMMLTWSSCDPMSGQTICIIVNWIDFMIVVIFIRAVVSEWITIGLIWYHWASTCCSSIRVLCIGHNVTKILWSSFIGHGSYFLHFTYEAFKTIFFNQKCFMIYWRLELKGDGEWWNWCILTKVT